MLSAQMNPQTRTGLGMVGVRALLQLGGPLPVTENDGIAMSIEMRLGKHLYSLFI